MNAHHLTLYPSDTPVTPAHVERLEKFCEENALPFSGRPEWIGVHDAARLPVGQSVTMAQMQALRALFEADRMDILCMPVRTRPYCLLLADMDATMVEGETLDDLAAHAGIGAQVAAITARAMNGELDFEGALRERVGLLKGLPATALQETLDKTEATGGADILIRRAKEAGCTCVLVSGGFDFFTNAIAARLGFDHNHGNRLVIENGKLTGEVETPVLGKEAKLAYLKEYTRKLGCDLSDTIAIGDGANDLPMLAAAGLGIGYRAKPVLADNILNILRFADLSLPIINHFR